MTDRRLDSETRTRLSDIQEGYLRISRRLLIAQIFQAVVLLLTIAAFTYLVGENRSRNEATRNVVRQIQNERKRNTFIACERRNADRAALRSFFATVIPHARRDTAAARKFIRSAEKAFPSSDCVAEARQLVKP